MKTKPTMTITKKPKPTLTLTKKKKVNYKKVA